MQKLKTVWKDMPGAGAVKAPLLSGVQRCTIRVYGLDCIDVLLMPGGLIALVRAADRLEATAFLALGRIVAAHAGQRLSQALSAPGVAVEARWNDAATIPWGRTSRKVTRCVLKTDTQHVRLFLLCDSLMPVTEVRFLHGPADDAILGAIGRALVRHQSACKISFS